MDFALNQKLRKLKSPVCLTTNGAFFMHHLNSILISVLTVTERPEYLSCDQNIPVPYKQTTATLLLPFGIGKHVSSPAADDTNFLRTPVVPDGVPVVLPTIYNSPPSS